MKYKLRAITRPPGHHFFGYYDMRPWDPTGRYHLCLEVAFMDRPPRADDIATIGMIDLAGGEGPQPQHIAVGGSCRFIPLTQTRAWNFQQGCMMHWLDERTVLFNDRREDRFVCVAHDVGTGRQRVLGPATADVTADGRLAATLNFARIAVTRPGYGYEGLDDPFADRNVTEQDGLGVLDLRTGQHRLVMNFTELAATQEPQLAYGMHKVYFNHVLFNPSGTLLSVIVRQVVPPKGWWTQLWTVGATGTPLLRCLEGPMVSHYDWKDDRTIIAWAGIDGVTGMWEFDALRQNPPRLLYREMIRRDGHIAYSHDRRRIVCDTYPDADGQRELFIAGYPDGPKHSLGLYHSPMTPGVPEIRCDFHPSFSADDRFIAFDGMHEGSRQRYVAELLS